MESVRIDGRVRQRTLLNLGRHFDVPREQWAALAQRIEPLVGGQGEVLPLELDAKWERVAQQYSARVIRAKAQIDSGKSPSQSDYQAVDINSVDLVRRRSVAIEHVGLETLRELGLDSKLKQRGFNGPQQAAAIGSILGRMTAPGRELFTHEWLVEQSALGARIDNP